MRRIPALTLGTILVVLAIAAVPAAAASPAPFPDLTMAPLVTPAPIPPIAAPPARDGSIPTDGYALGAADAPVTIDVFEDFQCPYCRLFTEQVEPQLVDTLVRTGVARLVFHDLAFLGEESRWAAVAGRLAAEQGLFWPLHDYLFANQLGENVGSFTPDRLMAMAQAAGLDMDKFISGLQVPAARDLWALIEAEMRDTASALGIRATPTVLVDGVPLASVDFATIAAAVGAALAPAPSPVGSSPVGSSPAASSPAASSPGAP
jgi:protein-disulfide isomerase